MTPRDNAIALYMRGIRDGDPRAAVAEHTGARYTQHSTGVAGGQEGFVAFFEPFLRRNPKRDIRVLRALQDGPKVFVHVHQSLNDGEAQWVTMDFFDSDEAGKIVEHWDVIAAYADRTPSGHSSIDGPTEIADLGKTQANREHVRRFVEACLIARETDRMADFVSAAHYIEHNANWADGLDAMEMRYAAPDCALSYQEAFHIVGEGNFVATLSRAREDGQDLCRADLWRMEDDMIVEHWDTSEQVPPRADWANSGKF
ncbi:MAG: nuclear transport factor 2 family protein [Pseudomonadota bacterium]